MGTLASLPDQAQDVQPSGSKHNADNADTLKGRKSDLHHYYS
ncbi:MAG TPA: hypothetical protein VLS45_09940 [Methylomicrobium sp.]|nr:hypothetical protein [Methylomicrobium sp.]